MWQPMPTESGYWWVCINDGVPWIIDVFTSRDGTLCVEETFDPEERSVSRYAAAHKDFENDVIRFCKVAAPLPIFT